MHTTTDRARSDGPSLRRTPPRKRMISALLGATGAALLIATAGPLGAASGGIGVHPDGPIPPKTSPTTTTTTTTTTTLPPTDDGASDVEVTTEQTEGGVEILQTSVSVTPKDDLDPNVETTLEVVGSGFDPTEPGIYVVFGPHRDAFWEHEDLFLSAQFLPVGGGLNPDGTFSTTLTGIVGSYEAAGQTVDCLAEQCYVITMKAHGNTDRSQDTFTPVNFAGGTTDGGGGGPTVDPTDNGGTQNGGASGGRGGTGGDSLASTGTDPLMPVVAAVAMIAIGAAFVVARRRHVRADGQA